jgi:hypothetical protein
MMVGMAAIALLPIVKGSTIPTVLFCGVATACVIWQRSKVLAVWTIAIFGASLVAGWLAAGQALQNLPNYFVAQSPIISGYTDAMSLDGDWVDIAVYACCGALLIWSVWAMKNPQRWLLMMASSLFVFLCFKAGFVRHDDHSTVAAFGLLFLAYLCAVSEPGWRSGAVLVVAGFSWVVILPEARKPDSAFIFSKFSRTVNVSLAGVLVRMRDSHELEAQFARANLKIRETFPLPKTDRTADLYPTDLSVLFANAGNWSPRPVLQSYSAYTPDLALRNAEHLRRAGASRVFFAVAPIDSRYPAIDDGVSWLSLLGEYQPSQFASGYLVLERVSSARPIELGAVLNQSEVSLGESTAVPQIDFPIFVKITVRPSALGRLATVVFKSPQLYLVAEYPGGEKRSYRYIAGMGESGFVLSPTISTAAEFAMLRTPNWKSYLSDRRPVRIGIFGGSGARMAWQESYEVKFFRIDVPVDEKAEKVVFPTPQRMASIAGLPVSSDCYFDVIDGSKVNAQPVRVTQPLLRVGGWAAVSAAKGIANERLSVALISSDGSAILFPLPMKLERQDLVRAFGHRQLLMAGFEGIVNTLQAQLPGELRLVQHLGSDTYVCDKALRIERQIEPQR